LFGWSEPEEHHTVETIGKWNDDDRELKEEDNMSQDAISGKETHLGRFAEKLTGWLGNGVESKTVPFTRPESDVTSIGFELSSKRKGDE